MTREKCLKVFENAHVAAVGIGGDCRITFWNDAARDLFGFPREAAMGKPCYEVISGLDAYGNRYCGPGCPLLRMWESSEPIRTTELVTSSAGTSRANAMISLDVPISGEPLLVHLFHPSKEGSPSAHPAMTAAVPVSPDLSERELQVLRFLAEAMPTAEIAREMSLAVSTVRGHIQRLLRKLGAAGRLEAVLLARRRGLL